MCKGGAPKYTPPAPPPEPAKPPRIVDPTVTQARTDEQLQARRRAGRSGTVLTNPALMNQANTGSSGGKTLLGQ